MEPQVCSRHGTVKWHGYRNKDTAEIPKYEGNHLMTWGITGVMVSSRDLGSDQTRSASLARSGRGSPTSTAHLILHGHLIIMFVYKVFVINGVYC
ncbi:hypothetical protein COCON_G00171960 [Conger conger]|uniref:Uncharacterized protein n=1 Tax=Conger conger TaxID=82655 RepID=A0A9Q1D813_CONCO|nr:hypothetical protein COCON_G00171960 [Conger conger]